MDTETVRENQNEQRRRCRLFGLVEAPVYRPSEAEFRDPFSYISQISPEASQYGICKIIPPKSWSPPFAIDPAVFRFKTRKQELNSVEGATRISLNYIDQLARFHRQFGVKLNKFPSVDKRPLDLYKLKSAVEKRGGFDDVCRTKKWAEIGRDLGYSGKIMSSLSTSLKNTYQRWLHPFENYLRLRSEANMQRTSAVDRQRPIAVLSDVTSGTIVMDNLREKESGQIMQLKTESVVVSGGQVLADTNNDGQGLVNYGRHVNHYDSYDEANAASATPLPTRLTLGSDKGREEVDRSQSSDCDGRSSCPGSRKRRREEISSTFDIYNEYQALTPQSQVTTHQPLCCVCLDDSSTQLDLQCSECERRAHSRCLPQGMGQISGALSENVGSSGQWLCHQCLIGDEGFGFEEGASYSLEEFKAKADNFKHSYLTTKLPLSEEISFCAKDDTTIEREFWRLVENLTESVVVEYGADIHSTIHGSGFPDLERMPAEPYAAHPWNLNNLPCNPSSLSRFIESDISGMTVPWLYVGMCFSTFCWHNEDHYMYSANYHHLGETKTWYGIPADDAEKFEIAMKAALPDLFKTQPDLLCQLVTLISPERLLKAGVRVYVLDQRAGEFVITFPKAYHAGFNHGFNVNEAVNFAPYEWEPFGASSVQRLALYHHYPCFSHEELLLKFARSDLTVEGAKWLDKALKYAWSGELDLRRELQARFAGLGGNEISKHGIPSIPFAVKTSAKLAGGPSAEHTCRICHCFCFFSYFHCSASDSTLCLKHASSQHCCQLGPSDTSQYDGRHVLHIADGDIRDLIDSVEKRARQPETWQATVCEHLGKSSDIKMSSLISLVNNNGPGLTEAAGVVALRDYVQKYHDWTRTAQLCDSRCLRNHSDFSPFMISNIVPDVSDQSFTARELETIRQLVLNAHLLAFESENLKGLQALLDTLLAEQVLFKGFSQCPQSPS